jgi:hypothetical protein
METVYDWLAIAIFAGLVVIFLQRSVGPRPDNDRMINYLPPAVGCAVGTISGTMSSRRWQSHCWSPPPPISSW